MESLEERLLCVEINEAAVYVTQIVLDVVASIAPFVSFLTLGNRVHAHRAQICYHLFGKIKNVCIGDQDPVAGTV